MIKLIKKANVQRELEFVFFSSGHIDELYKNNQKLFDKDGILITLLEEQINNESLLKFKDFPRLQIFSRDVNFSVPEMNYSEILKYYRSLDYNHSIIFCYADEIIDTDQLESEDFNQFSLIAIKRYEGFFGKKTGLFSIQFRGGKIDSFLLHQLEYQKTFGKNKGIHSFWTARTSSNNFIVLNALHNHRYDSSAEYGKCGTYTRMELKKFISGNKINYRLFFKRFVLRGFKQLFNFKLLFSSPGFYFYYLRAHLIESLIAFNITSELKKQPFV